MNDLQKDQAIYQAMYGFANMIFSDAVENSEKLRYELNENGNFACLKDLRKKNSPLESSFTSAIMDVAGYECRIEIGTFECSFLGHDVFRLLEIWKSLAKVKGEIVFKCEDEISNEYLGSIDISFDNPANAKCLANHVEEDELRPVLGNVLLEVDANAQSINFVASEGHVLGIITNNAESIQCKPEDEKKVYQALFSKSDWKRICDYAKKEKKSVCFKLYKRNDKEHQDTMVAVLGDNCIKSHTESCKYPNWRSVIQKNADKHFSIHPDDVVNAQKFVKSLKVKDMYDRLRNAIFVSFYRGSDIAYFDYYNEDNGTAKTAKFRLTKPSDITIGVKYNVCQLQKAKFMGFHLEDSTHATIVDSEYADYMLIMPMLSENGYVFNVEEREVVKTEKTYALVEVA